MKFTVVWKPTPADDLARIWSAATDRGAVAAAADQIDLLLRADPESVGESRSGSTRVGRSGACDRYSRSTIRSRSRSWRPVAFLAFPTVGPSPR